MAALADFMLTPVTPKRPTVAVQNAVLRQKLNDVYKAMRRHPRDPMLRLDLIELLLQTPRRDLIYRHIRRAMSDAPQAWGGLSQIGEVLFRMGEHAAARQVLERARDVSCLTARSYRTLAALLHKAGEPAVARRMLAASAMIKPVAEPPKRVPGLPNVLRIRCFDNGRYAMRRLSGRNLWTRSLKSGHFSLSDLLPKETINLWVLNAFGDNLSMVDDLPPVGLIINSVACADLNAPQLHAMSDFVQKFPDLPVPNHPDKVLRTKRRENAFRLSGIDGLKMPRT